MTHALRGLEGIPVGSGAGERQAEIGVRAAHGIVRSAKLESRADDPKSRDTVKISRARGK
jgi:hypothetical protein